jgi:hypothetical protein
MSKSNDLPEKMIAVADRDGLPENHDMRKRAALLSDATTKYFGDSDEVDVKQFMGHYARARRTWCDYTGEPLVSGL